MSILKVKDTAGLQSISGNAQVTAPVAYPVSGAVLRLDGVTPVSNAMVRLSQGATVKYTGASKADGTFAFTGVASGVYTIQVIKTGLTFTYAPSSTVTVTNAAVSGIRATGNR